MHVNLPEKLYYTIGEVSKAFKVNPSLIRFWEKEFEVLKPKKIVKELEDIPLLTLKIFKLFIIWLKKKDIPLRVQKSN
jgi:hypothetical protein